MSDFCTKCNQHLYSMTEAEEHEDICVYCESTARKELAEKAEAERDELKARVDKSWDAYCGGIRPEDILEKLLMDRINQETER